MENITLFLHVTDGGVQYLVDNHSFTDAKIIILLDGEDEAELIRCYVSPEEE